LAAGADAEKSSPTALTIAAAADLRFALDDLMKQFEEKYSATKVSVTYGSSGTSSPNFRTAPRSTSSSRLTSSTHGNLLKKAWVLMRFSFTQSAASLFGCQRIHRSL
jgi:hypothetical protein